MVLVESPISQHKPRSPVKISRSPLIQPMMPRHRGRRTSPVDEPVYDLGTHTAGIPIHEFHSQNFDFGGFIPLLKSTHQMILGIDLRLGKFLPYSLYQHVMVNHLNLQIAEVARQNGQQMPFRSDMRHALPAYQCIPKAIYDYISHVSDIVTLTGIKVTLNLPMAAIPRGDQNVSGSFGPVNVDTHNLYEAYISPLVTANRLIASQQNQPNYQPLPEVLIPDNLVPNENLLGYGPIELDSDAQNLLAGINFPDDNTVEGRYKIDATACYRVYERLAALKDRFVMVENAMIPQETSNANMTFVESPGPAEPLQVPLFNKSINVYANECHSSATANQSYIEVMHRRRAAAAPGPCYCTAEGATPEGWAATRDNNFNMQGIFGPVLHPDYEQMRTVSYTSLFPAGSRTLERFLNYNYKDKKII